MVVVVDVNIDENSSIVRTEKSSSCPAWMRWRCRSSDPIASVMAAWSTPSAAEMVMLAVMDGVLAANGVDQTAFGGVKVPSYRERFGSVRF